MQSILANEIFQKVDARQLGMMVRFYRADEVDAMLSDVRALVEAFNEYRGKDSICVCKLCKAIAAVKTRLKGGKNVISATKEKLP